MEFINPFVYGAPLFIGLLLLEYRYSQSHDNKELYEKKDMWASLSMGIGSAVIGPVFKTVFAVIFFYWIYGIFNPVVDGVRMNVFGWKSFGYAWYVWILCQLADDLSYYWFHRENHMIRILWAAHIVHHSSEKYNFGTGFRNGWFTIIYKPFFYMWILMIGFPVEMLFVCMGIEALWQFQLHSSYVPKLGIIEKFMNTHTMHQVHHSRDLENMDKNHGGFLNIFDKVFGTWKELDEDKDINFGVTHPPSSYNPWVILTHEYKDIWQDMKRSKNWIHKFKYVFGPPGWSHDGSTITVKQMQKNLKAELLEK